MTNKKLVLLDIDGTLINSPFSMTVSEPVKQAIARARKNGHIICISSGRSYEAIPKHFKDGSFDGIIGAAGASLTWKGKETINHEFSPEQISFLTKELEDTHSVGVWEGYHHMQMSQESSDIILEKMGASGKNNFFESEILTPGTTASAVNKVSVFFSGRSVEDWNSLLKGKGYTMVAFHLEVPRGHCGEITQSHLDKGSALKELAAFLQMDMADTVAIGDSGNDVSMLRAAGIGIAMGNATKEALEAADWVTGSVLEDGVKTAFEKLGLC